MTSERAPQSLTARSTDALVAVFLEEDGQEIVRYFTEDAAEATATDAVTHAALAALGSSGDLDWDEWSAELDRIRHESPPTPSIDDL